LPIGKPDSERCNSEQHCTVAIAETRHEANSDQSGFGGQYTESDSIDVVDPTGRLQGGMQQRPGPGLSFFILIFKIKGLPPQFNYCQ
jgi:hypothetical protein